MLSDRKATVSYAIDLLRAHQIRRENLFLHEELQRCCKEIAALRQEVKEGRAGDQENNEAYQKTRSALEEQNIRLNGQGQSLEGLQHAYATMQREISDLQAKLDQSVEHNQAHCEQVGKDIEDLKAGWQKLAQVQEEAVTSLDILRKTVDGKADNSVVEALAVQVDGLSIPQAERSLPSVSRVRDSFEPGPAPSNIPGVDTTIQVRDSQGVQGLARPEGYHEHEQYCTLAQEQRREATLPDDLDLDENANTFSYIGHRRAGIEETETLQPLPQPDLHASQLARVNLLRQRRFDDWDHYYAQGLMLVDTLPHTFEEAIVRNFVSGMFQDVQRRQCRQWLDAKGWTWDNIGLFGKLCSQLVTSTGPEVRLATEDTSNSSKNFKKALGAPVEHNTHPKGGDVRKSKASHRNTKAPAAPLRRSQRLVEKEASSQLYPTQRPLDPGLPDTPLADSQSTRRPTGARKQDGKSQTFEMGPRRRTAQKDGASPGFDDMLASVTGKADDGSEGVVTAAQQVANGKPAQISNAISRDAIGVQEARGPTNMETEARSRSVVSGLQRRVDAPAQPVPRLVPQKRRVVEPAAESSDDGGFLQKPQTSKYHSREARDVKQKKKQQKRRRLPLPPPPEIPILSTSE